MKNKIIFWLIHKFNIDFYSILMFSKGPKVNINSNFPIYHSKPWNRDTHISVHYRMIKQNLKLDNDLA